MRQRQLIRLLITLNLKGRLPLWVCLRIWRPINTRMVLEKGLRIFGSSRSGREDFAGLIELYKKHPDIPNYLENIVGSQIRVRSIADIAAAFETDIHKLIGKTIMVWDK